MQALAPVSIRNSHRHRHSHRQRQRHAIVPHELAGGRSQDAREDTRATARASEARWPEDSVCAHAGRSSGGDVSTATPVSVVITHIGHCGLGMVGRTDGRRSELAAGSVAAWATNVAVAPTRFTYASIRITADTASPARKPMLNTCALTSGASRCCSELGTRAPF